MTKFSFADSDLKMLHNLIFNHTPIRRSVNPSIDSWNVLLKMHFLDILGIFRLDMGQISSNLLKNEFAT